METKVYKITGTEADEPVFQEAGEILRRGGLVAFPTETVYGLGGNGLDAEASGRIYQAKGRPSDNPLILHIAERKELTPLVKEVPKAAELLMETYWPGPMTLIFQKSEIVPLATTGGLETVAIRMPSHPGARKLIEEAGVPIAAPSANLSGRPSPTTAQHVVEDLSGRIEMILDGGPCEIGLESTIIDVTGEVPMILRPGYIGRRELNELMGKVEMDPAVMAPPEAGLRPKAPGMKYRHYAPKAQVIIVEGRNEQEAAEAIRKAAEAYRAAGKRTAVLCSEETTGCYGDFPIKTLGSRKTDATIAHNLYKALREFDEEDTEFVFSESFGQGELGEAIMNRLSKAAGYHIVKAGEWDGKI